MNRITGTITLKRYQCTECGYEHRISTNHYGECHPKCPKCGWKKPLQWGQRHICLEPLPEGWARPEPWKTVKLGDICTIETAQKGKK